MIVIDIVILCEKLVFVKYVCGVGSMVCFVICMCSCILLWCIVYWKLCSKFDIFINLEY